MITALLIAFVLLAAAGVPIAVGMGIAVIVTMAFFTPLPTIGAMQRMVRGRLSRNTAPYCFVTIRGSRMSTTPVSS